MTESWLFLVLVFFAILPFAMLATYVSRAFIMAKFFPRQNSNLPIVFPSVSIIISCYNEEEHIRQKIQFFLSTEEWIPGSELIIVSGGSTDGTNAILREYENWNAVKIIITPERLGKIRSVNLAVSISLHDFLVFSDCRQTIKAGSVEQLLSNFSDGEVGTVAATLLANDGSKKRSFRNLLNTVSHNESRSGSCYNVFGALYAQRKSVFRTIPQELLFDDLFVVVSTLTQGKRLVMEPNAVIYDVPFERYYNADRVRRLTRGLLIFLHKNFRLILKMRMKYLLRFLIFKYLKLMLPISILATLVCTILIGIETQWNLGLQISSVLICALLVPFINVIAFFLAINFHMLAATLRYCFLNDRSNAWNKLKTSR